MDKSNSKAFSPVYIEQSASIHSAVVLMIKEKKSSVIICDANQVITGIITERDILRKISILDVDSKLNYPVSTIMNKPINYVYKKNLLEDIKKLHSEKGIRHFPVLEKPKVNPTIKDLIAFLSMTYLFQQFSDLILSEPKFKANFLKSLGIS